MPKPVEPGDSVAANEYEMFDSSDVAAVERRHARFALAVGAAQIGRVAAYHDHQVAAARRTRGRDLHVVGGVISFVLVGEPRDGGGLRVLRAVGRGVEGGDGHRRLGQPRLIVRRVVGEAVGRGRDGGAGEVEKDYVRATRPVAGGEPELALAQSRRGRDEEVVGDRRAIGTRRLAATTERSSQKDDF